MSSIKITKRSQISARSPWAKFGLDANPFPPSGLPSEVDYEDYQRAEIRKVITWLDAATDDQTKQWLPLLLKGSIGVGKTHVLRRIERAIVAHSSTASETVAVTYHIITGTGAKTLLLSNLLLEGFHSVPFGASSSRSGIDFPLVGSIFDHARNVSRDESIKWLEVLPPASPIRSPLRRIFFENDLKQRDLLEDAFSSWLSRRDLPRSVIERLGVAGRIEGEGEAVRAIAHVCKLAQAVVGFSVWVVLLDQIEDLWVNNEVTPLRRARFLTDLRTLIDEALEGTPISVVLAWNIDVGAGAVSTKRQPDVERKLKEEYVALYTRLQSPVDLPMLPVDHAYAFAEAYVRGAPHHSDDSNPEASQLRALFLSLLKRDFHGIIDSMPAYAHVGARLVQRLWIDALRGWAEGVANERQLTLALDPPRVAPPPSPRRLLLKRPTKT